MRFSLLVLCLLVSACASTPQAPDLATARAQLAEAERAWLDAYVTNDREHMARTLAPGFAITFPNGVIQTREQVIGGLAPEPTPGAVDEGESHFTEDRSIRLIGTTAILSGVYVNPGGDGQPDYRARYTDTWMWLNGRWQVVASHLSNAVPAR